MSQNKRNAKADSARSPAESNPPIIGVSDSLHSGLSGIKLVEEGMNCMTSCGTVGLDGLLNADMGVQRVSYGLFLIKAFSSIDSFQESWQLVRRLFIPKNFEQKGKKDPFSNKNTLSWEV